MCSKKKFLPVSWHKNCDGLADLLIYTAPRIQKKARARVCRNSARRGLLELAIAVVAALGVSSSHVCSSPWPTCIRQHHYIHTCAPPCVYAHIRIIYTAARKPIIALLSLARVLRNGNASEAIDMYTRARAAECAKEPRLMPLRGREKERERKTFLGMISTYMYIYAWLCGGYIQSCRERGESWARRAWPLRCEFQIIGSTAGDERDGLTENLIAFRKARVSRVLKGFSRL